MVSVPLRVAPGLASKLYLTTALPVPLVLPAVTCRKEALLVAVQAVLSASTTESAPAVGPSSKEVVPRVAGAGGAVWVTLIGWPRTVICPVRVPTGRAVNEKLTTPLALAPTVSQYGSLLGAKGPASDWL